MSIKYKVKRAIKNYRMWKASLFGFPKMSWRPIEKRKYLTREGIKEWYELTDDDMISLNITPNDT